MEQKEQDRGWFKRKVGELGEATKQLLKADRDTLKMLAECTAKREKNVA